MITANDFPHIVAAPLTYQVGEQLKEWTGMSVPVSTDDGLPVGTASGESYTLFTPKEAMAYLCEVLAGTGYKVLSLGMVFDRSRWFVSFELVELAARLFGGVEETEVVAEFVCEHLPDELRAVHVAGLAQVLGRKDEPGAGLTVDACRSGNARRDAEDR